MAVEVSSRGIDGRRLVDSADASAVEQALRDEISEPQDGDGDAPRAHCDTQQRKGNHRGEDLQANGIVVVTKELADLEVLFDPAKQQLDLPAAWRPLGT